MILHPARPRGATEIGAALGRQRGWLFGVAVFSAGINLLSLTASLYMLQVYDRVLTSRSTATLIALSVMALAAFAVQWWLDTIRGRMLTRIGVSFAEDLSPRVLRAATRLPTLDGTSGTQSLRDLDLIRSFLAGQGPAALFDIPFMPLFLAATFLIHPWLGLLTLTGALVIALPTLVAEVAGRRFAMALADLDGRRQAMMEALRRNAVAVAALGMQNAMEDRLIRAGEAHNAAFVRAGDIAGGGAAVARALRTILQSGSLGLGAYLAIHGEISAGAIIAASILTTRALAPVEGALAQWRQFMAARGGLARLTRLLAEVPAAVPRHPLPSAYRSLLVEGLAVVPPGQARPCVEAVGFSLAAGDGLGVIGPTGSGKSTLARTLVGAWPAARGSVRLDGARLDQWGDDLGRQIGYLPQEVELFDGTVAENIARFRSDMATERVIEAAEAAGVHDMIVRLPQGYDTRVGDGGMALSGGQRQRIGLARALFGAPFLLVLDEPNANLDHEGDQALAAAIAAVRERQGIVIVVTHRPSGLLGLNRIVVLKEGRVAIAGDRDEVLAELSAGRTTAVGPRPVVTPIGARA